MEKISIYLMNLSRYVCGQAVGQWIKLPISSEARQTVFEALGIDEENSEYFIADYKSTLGNISISEYSRLDELNEFAERLEELTDYEYEKLAAIIEAESPSTIAAIIELIGQLDDFDWLPDIFDDEALGDYYVAEYSLFDSVPENLRSYLDTERLGRDIRLESNCCFTSYGLIIDNR